MNMDPEEERQTVTGEENIHAEETPSEGDESGDEDAAGPEGQSEAVGEKDPGAGTSTREQAQEELKIVLHLRNGRASAGIWKPGTDPHLETLQGADTDALLEELPSVIERAKARWADSPLRPKHNPPKKERKGRNNSGDAQTSQQPQRGEGAGTEEDTGTGERQTAMRRLF